MPIIATLSQVSRRSVASKRALSRTYFTTPITQFSQNEVKKQEEKYRTPSSESTSNVSHESPDSDAPFNPVINHVFDE
ncbi:hypothetical protein BY458DRAFT_443586 [Sporodiniella umbellata]|nr:hypothetical protein BY458DRAFT_443586 [Sporodiniella umbellata]